MGFGFKKREQEKVPWLHRGVLTFFTVLGIGIIGKLISLPFQSHTELLKKMDKFLVAASGVSKERSSAAYTINQAVQTQGDSLTLDNIGNLLDTIHSSDLQQIQNQYDHPEFLKAIQEGAGFKEDILSLLGFGSPQSYLIALQNTSERRPNGGFFGSFALVTFDAGVIKEFDVIDSYLPGYDKPGTTITGPSWLQEFLPDRTVHFVGANKIGFTYHDGHHIKTLYEKSYPGKKIRGVVFLTTDLFEKLIPGFEQQLWERQFTNASVDLIRGNDSWGKKEYYLNSSRDYFKDNAGTMLLHFFKNIEEIRSAGYVNIYLTSISGPLHGYLRRQKLTTRFENDTVYLWDSNISFNKIDRFVERVITCTSEKGDHQFTTHAPTISLSSLHSGIYTCVRSYTLDVPEEYRAVIKQFEKKYDIRLTEREEHILGLDPEWHTRAIIYYPKTALLRPLPGDGYDTHLFDTPFSQAVTYKVRLGGEQRSKQVSFVLEVP